MPSCHGHRQKIHVVCGDVTHVRPESSGRRGARGRRSWSQVVRAAERARGEKWETFAARRGDPGLALALYVGRRCTGLTLRELGEAAGGMDYNAAGMAIRRLERRMAKDSPLRRMAERILNERT
jgi:hypothetical protein